MSNPQSAPFHLGSLWQEVIDGLVAAHAQGSDAFMARVDELTHVVKEGAIAHKAFGYLRFEPAHDSQMKVADIAGVFTQEDYPQAVEELFVSPARVMTRVTDELQANPALAELATPENLDRFSRIAVNALVVELGNRPPDLAERLAAQDAERAQARPARP